jgi:hypothetical protein
MAKYKKGKKVVHDTSIEKKHKAHLNKLEEIGNVLPEKKKELVKLRKELSRLDDKDPYMYTNRDIISKANLRDKIDDLNDEIIKIENNNKESDYILAVAPILESYYDTKKNQSNKKVVSFEEVITGKIVNNNEIELLNEKFMETINNKKKLIKRKTDRCDKPECLGQMITNQDEGKIICCKCGKIGPMIMDIEKTGSKDTGGDKVPYAYKRQNHLKEILTQIQAQQVVEILDEDLQAIKMYIKQKRLRITEIDYIKMKKILKNLGMDRHYEHTSYILFRVCKIKPPQFAREAVQEVERRFAACQKPFYIYKPPDRKNFLSYSYVLHKLFEMIGYHEYCQYFRLLKNKKKLMLQEDIWKKICIYCNWTFIECGRKIYY